LFSLHEEVQGRGGILSLILSLCDQLHDPAPLLLGGKIPKHTLKRRLGGPQVVSVLMRKEQYIFLAKESHSCNQSFGVWVGPRVGLDTLEKRKLCYPQAGLNYDSSVMQPMV